LGCLQGLYVACGLNELSGKAVGPFRPMSIAEIIRCRISVACIFERCRGGGGVTFHAVDAGTKSGHVRGCFIRSPY
jgi:hypothetical protein